MRYLFPLVNFKLRPTNPTYLINGYKVSYLHNLLNYKSNSHLLPSTRPSTKFSHRFSWILFFCFLLESAGANKLQVLLFRSKQSNGCNGWSESQAQGARPILV